MNNHEQVSCRVIKSCYDFAFSRSISLESIIHDHGSSMEIIGDSYGWTDTVFYNAIIDHIENGMQKTGISFQVGIESIENNSWKDIENVIKAIGDIRPILQQIDRFSSYFFREKLFSFVENKPGSAIITPVDNSPFITNAVNFIAGSITSVPLLWNGEPLSALKLRDGSIKINTSGNRSFFDTPREYKNYSPRLLEEIVAGLEKNKELIEEKNRLLKKKNSELHEAYIQLEKSTDKKIQNEKMAVLGRLATGIAHEINNPLSFVISNFRSIGDYFLAIAGEASANIPENITSDIPKVLAETEEGLHRVKKLVEDINYMAHPGHGKKTYANVKDLIRSSLRICRNLYKNDISVTESYGHKSDVFCIPSRLSQVFLNILLNSIYAVKSKPAAAGGEILIKTSENKKNLTVSFRDNGTGIPEQNISQIFEPFFTTKIPGEGTGLGLSTAQSIIQSHNGEISCASRENEWTEITIRLPLSKDKASKDIDIELF
ncbi:MAG: HAMP domain-containing histidine kinase [Oligoflexia bacterium]|nr:HAMP domain-containing histidine kinase [Oligoflexia bacterium]